MREGQTPLDVERTIDEFVGRLEAGGAADLADWIARYPALEVELRPRSVKVRFEGGTWRASLAPQSWI